MRGMALAVVPILALVWAACGGGGTSAPTPTNTPRAVTSPTTAAATAAPSATRPPATATAAPTATPAASSGLTGTWTGTWQNTNIAGSGTFTLQLTQSGSTVAGTIVAVGTPCLTNGTISGALAANQVQLGAVQGVVTITYAGTVSGNSMSGTYQASAECANAQGTWAASKS